MEHEMKYETFEAEFTKQNKQLRIVLGISAILLIIILILVLSDKKYFVLKNSSLVNDRPLLTWVCEESFQSIAKETPINDLIEQSILNELGRSEFKVSSDEVLSVLAVKNDLCRIIVKGDGKIRSFLINFKANKSYPFYFKLSEINESEITSTELELTEDEK